MGPTSTKKVFIGVTFVAQQVTNPTSNHEDVGSVHILMDLLGGLRIPHCHELWCRSQTRLRSRGAMAVVYTSGYSSDSTPSLETPICCR